MREAEMDTLAMPWANARAAHLLAVRRMTPVEVGNDQEEGYDTNKVSPLMYTQKTETLEPFSSHVIPVKTTKAYLGERLNVMVQALYAQDGTLPPGLTVQNTYTELRKGSKRQWWWCRITLPTPKLLGRRLPWQGQFPCYQCLNPPSPRVCKWKTIHVLTSILQS